MKSSTALLNEKHFLALTAFGITSELLEAAGVRSVTDVEARNQFGMRFREGSNLGGILFPYLDPKDNRAVTYRLRRDDPERDENGKPRNKYLSTYGDWRHLYFCPGAGEQLQDSSVPVILVEAEKSALALTALAQRSGHKWLVIATGGCWGWRGRIGKRLTAKGEREDVCGALVDFQYVLWRDRRAVIIFDANAAGNASVQTARRELADELATRGATVSIVELPAVGASGAKINGPDDMVAIAGDEAMLALIGSARTVSECALNAAEAAIARVREQKAANQRPEFAPALSAIAAVTDPLRRRMLCASLAALKLPGLLLRTIEMAVEAECGEYRQTRAAAAEHARQSALRSLCFDPRELMAELEKFFAERAWLPEGGAMVLALWTAYTWCVDYFDTAPYLCLDSATPGCGKTTVLELLRAVCARPVFAANVSEPVLFRAIDTKKPTLLLDEAELLTGRSPRAEALRTIIHAGYRRGATALRCDGEDNQVRDFELFGPKAFASIGALKGALLDRSIVLHLERMPADFMPLSASAEDVAPTAEPLRDRLESLALQCGEHVKHIRSTRPPGGHWPQFFNREGELWSPLLTIARLMGREYETRAVAVGEHYLREKARAQEMDAFVGQTQAIVQVLRAMTSDRFTPGELVPALLGSESWAERLHCIHSHVGRTTAVGIFLQSFRLKNRVRSHGATFYSRVEALELLTRHTPAAGAGGAAGAAAVENSTTCEAAPEPNQPFELTAEVQLQ